MRSRYLVAYDVSDAKRLRRVFKKMQGYGDALQYSIFACDLSRRELVLMIGALEDIIHQQEDRILIVDLGPTRGRAEQRLRTIGRQDAPPKWEALVI